MDLTTFTKIRLYKSSILFGIFSILFLIVGCILLKQYVDYKEKKGIITEILTDAYKVDIENKIYTLNSTKKYTLNQTITCYISGNSISDTKSIWISLCFIIFSIIGLLVMINIIRNMNDQTYINKNSYINLGNGISISHPDRDYMNTIT